jgi:S1-C subfamily serine protease
MRSQAMRYSMIAATVFGILGMAWGQDDVPPPPRPATPRPAPTDPSITDQIKRAEEVLDTLKAISKKLEETKAAEESDDSAAYHRAVGSIVSIIAIDRNWDTYQGAGIVIDEKRGDILTAYHVIGDDRPIVAILPERDKGGQVITAPDHYQNVLPSGCAVVLGWSKSRDLALIRWKTPHTGLKALPMAAQGAAPGRAVFGIGCGNNAWWQSSSGAIRSVATETYTSTDGLKVSARVISTTVPVNPGDSGGALISRSGELLGVMVSYRKDLNAVSKSIDLSEIRDFIKEIRKLRKEEP